MSTAPIISDLQKVNPSAIIELFTLQTVAAIHGSSQIYRFHNGSNLNANNNRLHCIYHFSYTTPYDLIIDIFFSRKIFLENPRGTPG